ncbi:MAG: hypothetical protein N2512_04320 [Armatimonadetes bacterium]|nr:hypothetical protein [Armatimonadota bacterium]
MTDYIDEDVAYLVGLLAASGTFSTHGDTTSILIEFPFRTEETEGRDTYAYFVAGVAQKVLPRIQRLLGPAASFHSSRGSHVAIRIQLPAEHLALRDLRMILGLKSDERPSRVPEVVKNDSALAIEFLRGFADAGATVRRSNRDQSGLHRVYLDVRPQAWHMATGLCQLLQSTLQVPVQGILWNHPNLRTPGAAWAPSREHQVRVYADAFEKVGFYLDLKNAVLRILAGENRKARASAPTPCDGASHITRKRGKHRDEGHDLLPDQIRGRHFNHYTEICAVFGCRLACRGS